MTTWVLHRVVFIVVGCALITVACTPETVYIRSLRQVTLVSHNRLYPAYAETTVVAPGERFAIGDGAMSARVVRYLPEFQMDTLGEASSRSNEPANPAVRLEVLEGRMRRGYVWAFLHQGAPHFRAKDDLAFTLVTLTLSDGRQIRAAERAKP